jgi:hypothetical protein
MRANGVGRRLASVAVAVVGVFMLAGPIAANPSDLRKADYVGIEESFSGLPATKVRLELRSSSGGQTKGRFTARDVYVRCDDNTNSTRSLPPLTLRPGGDGMVRSRYVNQPDGVQTYYRVEVRFVRGGAVARGWIVYLETSLDPADGPQRPDCSVGERLHWKANRVGG